MCDGTLKGAGFEGSLIKSRWCSAVLCEMKFFVEILKAANPLKIFYGVAYKNYFFFCWLESYFFVIFISFACSFAVN